MKSAKEIASRVEDKYKHKRQYPVGKAQETILDALGIDSVSGNSHAKQIFEALGIVVSSKRVGRTSVPVVTKTGAGSARTPYGDYDVWSSPADDIDLSALDEWMED